MYWFIALAVLGASWAVFWGGAFRMKFGRWPCTLDEWTPH